MKNMGKDESEPMICAISSSIANFYEKILWHYRGLPWHPLRDIFHSVVFFGLYHEADYAKYALHRGDKTVVWCGSDILRLQKSWFGQHVVKHFRARHICENEVEQNALSLLGISAQVRYIFYEDPNDFPVSFVPSKTPHVFLHCHGGKDAAYGKVQSGLNIIERLYRRTPWVTFHIYGIDKLSHNNICYHGHVLNEQFNREIRNYQAGLRLHAFDGISEIMVKSVLLGQYPITVIPYPHIDLVRDEKELVKRLKELRYKKKPHPYRDWWFQELMKKSV